jgi:hypothetical protein
MEGPVSLEPVASSDPASFADPAHLLELFLQVISAESLKDFDLGHAGLFNSWLVTWLMVWQRSQGNASMAEAVAETLLGTTFNYLPECKRVLDRNISPNTSAYSQGRSRLPLEAAIHVADTAFATLTAGLPPAWKGRPAYLIDGSSLTLTHQPELVEQFPPAVNQYGASHWPVVLFVAAHELSTGFSPLIGDNYFSLLATIRIPVPGIVYKPRGLWPVRTSSYPRWSAAIASSHSSLLGLMGAVGS